MTKTETKNTVNFNKGMVLPELILGMIFLVSFGLVIASTSSLLNKLISLNNFNYESNDYKTEINLVKKRMKEWAGILSQASYTKEEINKMGCSEIPNAPKTIWNLPHKPVDSPSKNYQFCVSNTSLQESGLEDLISNKNIAMPGIYILYAKPNIKSSYLPLIRILFCRPRVFCKI